MKQRNLYEILKRNVHSLFEKTKRETQTDGEHTDVLK